MSSNLNKALSRHLSKAINKTASKIAREQAKLIKKEMDIELKKIRKMIFYKKANPNNLKVSLRAMDTHISIKHFKKTNVMNGKKIIGVNVKPKAGKGNVFLKGHFIAKSKTTGGEFIAIRGNSKHEQSPLFTYKPSKKSYPNFKGEEQKLYYPLSLNSFSKVAKSQAKELENKVREEFLKNLEL
ncbi:hypothetical protein BKH41_03740 [Helicobacter sp. 12S02232-10]|uniref:hypothetical protein n=1 Tax=Helicobacter sp. 12S02232-10 TaxID=1476197 RepID=UPI000BA7B6A6|nr:hypothetical protein [Helicobacter sp. 12S02232-10]PAF49204.1 hypothetical protein BKH41_03740 [Helicobacter sp. 12S02232-10]